MDATAAVFSYYDFTRASLIVEDEIFIEKDALTSDALLNLIKAKEASLGYIRHHRVADNGNPLMLADWSSIHKMSFTYPKKASIRAMANSLRVWFSSGRIIINPRCVKLISCLKEAQWKIDTNGNRLDEFARSETHGHSDLLAALIYAQREAESISNINPIPKHYGIHHHDGWINPYEEKSDLFGINMIVSQVEDQLN
jgi:hypothetical protein